MTECFVLVPRGDANSPHQQNTRQAHVSSNEHKCFPGPFGRVSLSHMCAHMDLVGPKTLWFSDVLVQCENRSAHLSSGRTVCGNCSMCLHRWRLVLERRRRPAGKSNEPCATALVEPGSAAPAGSGDTTPTGSQRRHKKIHLSVRWAAQI